MNRHNKRLVCMIRRKFLHNDTVYNASDDQLLKVYTHWRITTDANWQMFPADVRRLLREWRTA